MSADKVRDNRVRRMAERQGFALRKVRRRDPRALEYAYFIIDPRPNAMIAGPASLDAVEDWLTSHRRTNGRSAATAAGSSMPRS